MCQNPQRSIRLAEITGGDHVIIEGGGHLPQARDPVKVNLLLRDFVRRARVRLAAETLRRRNPPRAVGPEGLARRRVSAENAARVSATRATLDPMSIPSADPYADAVWADDEPPPDDFWDAAGRRRLGLRPPTTNGCRGRPARGIRAARSCRRRHRRATPPPPRRCTPSSATSSSAATRPPRSTTSSRAATPSCSCRPVAARASSTRSRRSCARAPGSS